MPHHHDRDDWEEERRERHGGGSPKKHGSPKYGSPKKHGHSEHHASESHGGYGAPPAGQYGGGYGAPYGGPPQNDVNFQNAVHVEAQRMEQERLGNLQRMHHDQQADHRNEQIGGVGALAAGAFAMYEGYEAKKDPTHAKQHMLEAEIAGAAAVAAGGYAVYEHHQKTTTETKIHQLDGTPEEKHGWF